MKGGPRRFLRFGAAEVLSGAPFKAVAAGVLVSLTILAVIAWAVGMVATEGMREQYETGVLTEVELFRAVHEERGVAGVRQLIADTARPGVVPNRRLGLFAPDGTRLAGDVPVRRPEGWSIAPDGPAASAKDAGSYATSAGFNDNTFVIETEAGALRTFVNLLVAVLVGGWLAASAVTVALGYLYSRGTWERLSGMARTLEHVSLGDVTARLPVASGGSDQIDRISALMNGHLDRLERVMTTTRNTAAAMAHELRAPLTRASIALQDAEERAPSNVAAHLERAQNELRTLDRMFATILRIGRVQARVERLVVSDIDLRVLAADICETYEPVIEDGGRDLTFEPCPSPVPVRGDADMLYQALANLIENAVQHTPAGTSVTVSTHLAPEGAVLRVADDGPGIDAERRSDALQPFRQVAHGASIRTGSGLGLSLVRAMVDAHGGTLRLENNDPGLRVEIVLPAKP